MNKQGQEIDGLVVGGIEWTKTILMSGIERHGWTWNPVAGCLHGCQWQMPDGTIANCYAEDIAERVAGSAYPEGFEHHYWYPDRLNEPIKVTLPARIFVGSMADVFGHWTPDEQVQDVIDVTHKANWHTYQFLTKNPRRYAQFSFGRNCWLGASTPPSFMWDKELSIKQREAMFMTTLGALETAAKNNVTWLSAEPLSWDIVPILQFYPGAIKWIVIGAASNGRKYYPPDEYHVRRLTSYCQTHGIAVFFKGNLRSLSWAASNWREEFPA